MKTKGLFTPAGLGVAVILFLALHVLSGVTLRSARIDLTENKLYTLTDGSKRIASSLDEPITLRFYFSKGLTSDIPPFLVSYATRVRELLDEYVAVSGGKLRLEVVDPEPFSEQEDQAVAAGLQGMPINEARDQLYFGLVATNAVDETETIPFFDPRKEEFLEYDISHFIYKLAHPERPVVGLITSLPMEGSAPQQFPGAPPPQQGWFILEQMRDLFEVRSLEDDLDAVPDDVDVLLLVHPKGLSDDTLYAIDQWVLKGGKAFVFVDPHCEQDQPPTDPNNPMASMGLPRSSDLEPLLKAWGVAYDPDQVVGDQGTALMVTAGSQRRPETVPFVAFLGLGPDQLDREDPVTADLGEIRMGYAGALSPVDGATTTFIPLMTSSDQSALIGADKLRFMPDPKQLLQDFVPTGQRYTLAARVTGPCSSAFPDGRPGGADDTAGTDGDDPQGDDAAGEQAGGGDAESATPGGHLAESTGPIQVVVVADADMLADRWWVQVQSFLGQRVSLPTSDNADFAVNCLDNLSGSTDLISVRSRGRFERPFEKIEDLRVAAEQRFLERENALQAKLRETEQRINDLQRERADGSSALLTPEQRAEIEKFRDEQVTTRKELRSVQNDLRKDIESLQGWLKFGNILGVPILLAGFALGSWFLRNRR